MNWSGKYKLLLLTWLLSFLPHDKDLSSHIYENINTDPVLEESIPVNVNTISEDPIDVIMIDAGHGGKDVGCQGNGLSEKDVALEITLLLGKYLQQEIPNLEVRYTRSDDTFIPLHERASRANEDDVDLFISIHANATKKLSAHGVETFVMGLHTSEENMEVAKRENDVVLMEDLSGFDFGYDPYSAEGHIMLAAQQQHTLSKSIQLAAFTQSEIIKNTDFKDRGVKQAGFVVLRKVLIPSILVEAGFISNASDARKLKNKKVLQKIASSIGEGISSYIAHYSS